MISLDLRLVYWQFFWNFGAFGLTSHLQHFCFLIANKNYHSLRPVNIFVSSSSCSLISILFSSLVIILIALFAISLNLSTYFSLNYLNWKSSSKPAPSMMCRPPNILYTLSLKLGSASGMVWYSKTKGSLAIFSKMLRTRFRQFFTISFLSCSKKSLSNLIPSKRVSMLASRFTLICQYA